MRPHRISYPRRLHALLRWSALLTHEEATACIRDFRSGLRTSSEAVNHFGGTERAIHDALRFRRWPYGQSFLRAWEEELRVSRRDLLSPA